MASETETIRVNFGKPVPLFPLPGVVLLPHAILPLHIFEERYRQMVARALDATGQIALAVYECGAWKQQHHDRPPLRPAVCLGQIIQHERLPDGRFNVLMRGVCRARISQEIPPDDVTLYRRALLEPVEHGLETDEDYDALTGVRDRLRDLFREPPLTALAAAQSIETHLDAQDLPTIAILELLAITVVSDTELKYRLLEEGDPSGRAAMIEGELRTLQSLLRRAEPQRDPGAPKGVTWN